MLLDTTKNLGNKIFNVQGGKVHFNFDILDKYISNIIGAIIVLVIILFTIKIGNKIIDKVVKKQIETNSRFSIDEKRANTFGSLLKSILKYTVYALGIFSLITIFTGNTIPVTVFSSIGGVAIGLGAQGFVKDLINGLFILFEDQYAVGDYVTIDKYKGIVETIGIRSTTLRDFSGDHHIIPNGTVSTVTNHTKGNVQIKVEVEIAYEESIDKSIEVITKACNKFGEINENVVNKPKVIGVTAFGPSGMTIKVIGDVQPMTQWAAEAELRKLIKESLDEEGIEIPYNKVKIVNEVQNV